ncbi:MAG: hypothetical protein N2Z79_05015, partial [Candidatus Omnitrophica bacterium]|nr:hypothetical protein [Candidatus Omnitrophota bacterium]
DYIVPIKELSRTKLWYVLVIPYKEVSSSFIYKEFDRLDGFRLTRPIFDVNILIWGLKEKDPILIQKGLFNHLEGVTAKFYPEINKIKEVFFNLGIKLVSMSGKGLCVFGLFFKRKEAHLVCKYLRKSLKGHRVYLTENDYPSTRR